MMALGACGLASTTAAVAPAASQTEQQGAQQAPRARAAGPAPATPIGVAVSARRLNVAAGRSAWVRGAVRRAAGVHTVRLQRRSGERWVTIDRDRTDVRGRYRLAYRPRQAGSHVVRVRVSGDPRLRPAVRRVGRLNAFRRTSASWYGPGFYGRRTACGTTFSAGVMGVAHKTLPCGTRLTLRRGTRIARVRVIDRGPFHAGREFDLSPAVKRRLGFGSTGTVDTTV
jgi:hypothetical protein